MRLVVLFSSLLFALSACSGARIQGPSSRPAAAPQKPTNEEVRFRLDEKFDWLRLGSGEWLKGELKNLRDGSVEFDSDELDDLNLDFDDVAEIHVARGAHVRLEDDREFRGPLVVRNGRVRVGGPAGTDVDRDLLLAVIPGEESESNYWSGEIAFGFTGREGNTRQLDTTMRASALRQTVDSRFEAKYSGSYGHSRGVETANSQRFNTGYDVFLTRELYITPLSLELFHDPFQNIELRARPTTGAGYRFLDDGTYKLEGFGGLAMLYTRYESVPPGTERSETETAAVFSGRFEWDVTPDVEWDFLYEITVPVSDAKGFTHHFESILSVDLTSSLDLDVTFVWDRDNDPQQQAGGEFPEEDDFRLSVSVAYDF